MCVSTAVIAVAACICGVIVNKLGIIDSIVIECLTWIITTATSIRAAMIQRTSATNISGAIQIKDAKQNDKPCEIRENPRGCNLQRDATVRRINKPEFNSDMENSRKFRIHRDNISHDDSFPVDGYIDEKTGRPVEFERPRVISVTDLDSIARMDEDHLV